MSDIFAGLVELAVEVGFSGSKGGCLFALGIVVVAVVITAGIYYVETQSCDARCVNYGTATFVGDACLCRTPVGTLIDPSSPPRAY